MTGERWHQGGSSIRDIIFGMNDGLLSMFSLVTGVAGGTTNNSVVILAGLAGAVAGAISMAAGAYVSTKAEKEVLEKHLQMEASELETMPETEAEELALMYELKGVSPAKSRNIAKSIMSNKKVALETMAREELGFAPEETGNPLKAGLTSGVSFVIGSSLPVLPWILLPGKLALYTSIGLSLCGFFAVGVCRTLVTGKNPWKSGLEMFAIGTIAAIITYLIGSMIGVSV
jgi:VIT1/CCC1 family predicted Fe2+/Mn2+ transporter